MRELVQTSLPLEAARVDTTGRLMKGYAAVFNRPAVQGDPDGPKLIVHPKAFDKTIKERGAKIKVLYNHGRDPYIGSFPLGRPRVLRADDYGLYTETLLDENDFNKQRLIPGLASGSIDGMSITAGIVRDMWNEDGTERTFLELALEEFGPVTFPLFDDTTAMVASRAVWAPPVESEMQERKAESPPAEGRDTEEAVTTLDRRRLTASSEEDFAEQQARLSRLWKETA